MYGTKTGRLRMLRSERVAPPGIVDNGAAGGRDDAMDLDGRCDATPTIILTPTLAWHDSNPVVITVSQP